MTAREALHLIKEERVLVIAVLVLTIAGSVMAGRIMPPDTSAIAQVQVYDDARGTSLLGISEDAETPEHDVLMDTHIRLATSPTIAQRVIARLGLAETPHTALERITVTALGRSTVLTVRATAPDPAGAAKLADTWVAEYVAWRTETLSAELAAASQALAPRITAAAARLDEVEARIKASGHTRQIDTALAAATTDYEQLLATQARLDLLASIDGPPVAIVAPATAEESSEVITIAIDALKGLVAGVFLAIVIVFLRRHPAPAVQPD